MSVGYRRVSRRYPVTEGAKPEQINRTPLALAELVLNRLVAAFRPSSYESRVKTDYGWLIARLSGVALVFKERLANQCVGLSVAETVLCPEPRDEFDVFGEVA